MTNLFDMPLPTVTEAIAALTELGLYRPSEPAPTDFGTLVAEMRAQHEPNVVMYDAEGFLSADDYRALLEQYRMATGGALLLDGVEFTETPASAEADGPVDITVSVTLGGVVRSHTWVQESDWIEEDFIMFVDELVAEGTPGEFLDLPDWSQCARLIYVPHRAVGEEARMLFARIQRVPYEEVYPATGPALTRFVDPE